MLVGELQGCLERETSAAVGELFRYTIQRNPERTVVHLETTIEEIGETKHPYLHPVKYLFLTRNLHNLGSISTISIQQRLL